MIAGLEACFTFLLKPTGGGATRHTFKMVEYIEGAKGGGGGLVQAWIPPTPLN